MMVGPECPSRTYDGCMFVDEARVSVAAGRGGDGAVSFHREKYQPRGGPDGGNAGRGGSVVLVADGGVGSLAWLRDHPHQRAADGSPGRSNNRSGADGADLTLRVPAGTVVRDDEGRVLADLPAAGDRYVVATGGRGGRGNAAFLSDSRRAPGFGELGEPGEARRVHLELRLIAEVAVIGLPNAGKSTLVGALSAARPKVAAYPFTTLEPTLGRVERAGPDRSFTICDIPGLIQGAHEGIGLDALVASLVEVVAAGRADAGAPSATTGFELFRTERRALAVERDEDGTWRVRGGPVERWVAMCDLGNPQAVAHLQERLDRAGVERALAAAG